MSGPDRIWAWPRLVRKTDGGTWSDHELPRSTEYIRRDPAVIAALPEVQAIVAEAAKAEREKLAERKTFPILGVNGARFDLQLVQDHGKQANANHGQTVTGLANRGGLSWCELHAVLHDRPYVEIDTNEAMRECRALEAQYLAAIRKRGEG